MVNKTITMSIPSDLLESIDRIKGDVTRSKWMCRAIEARLRQMNKEKRS